MKYFYLGTSEVRWLGQANVPLFISHRRLAPRKSFPRALTGWALDSGGFTELSMYGQWRTTARDYNAAVWRYNQEIGNLQWASPGDWMCEPEQIARTGLSVREHQRRTIDNFQELQDLWPGPDWDVPYVPVLQGWTPDDYRRCVDMYYAAGVDLSDCFLVGVGTMKHRGRSLPSVHNGVMNVHNTVMANGVAPWTTMRTSRFPSRRTAVPRPARSTRTSGSAMPTAKRFLTDSAAPLPRAG